MAQDRTITSTARSSLGIFLGAGLLLFGRLGEIPLINPDEGRNAVVAWEMQRTGTWVVPTLNGLPYLDKPALFFKTVALSLSTFGHTETAARLPSAVSAAALLGVVFVFCRRTYGARTAAFAVAILATTPLIVGFGRLVILDMPLALFSSAAILAGYLAEEHTGTPRRRWYLWGAAASAVATLIKGPVGFLVPGLVLLVFHLVERRPAAIARVVAPGNVLLFLAIVLPCFVAVARRHADFLYYGLVEETLRRYVTPAFRRTEPIYYYGPVLMLAFYPWSALLPAGLALAWRARTRLARADRLLISWAVVVIAFFSTSQSKRPGYILTGVVALGILTARLLNRAFADRNGPAARLVLGSTLGLALATLAAGAVLGLEVIEPGRLPHLLHFRSKEFNRLEPALLPLVVSLLGVAGAALAARLRRDLPLALAAYLLPAVLLLTVSFGVVARYADASSSRRLAQALPPRPPGALVACLECFPIGLPFYLAEPVTYITMHGGALTSNYVRLQLRTARDWPDALVRLDDRDRWLAGQANPVYMMARQPARGLLDQIAVSRGRPVTEIHPGWWLAVLPPSMAR